MPKTGTTFSLRPVRREELEAWVDLANQSRYWQEDAAGTIFDDTLRPPDEPLMRLGAWTADETLAGAAQAVLGEDGSRLKDRAQGLVGVAVPYRRQGLVRGSLTNSSALLPTTRSSGWRSMSGKAISPVPNRSSGRAALSSSNAIGR